MAIGPSHDDGLGGRLKQLRSELGLTQAEVARRAGVSAPYLSELEGGHGRRPSGEVLLRLAEALGVTIAELLGRELRPPDDQGQVTPSLEEFARDRGLGSADVKMLASIRFRGEPPRTPRRWAMIYDAIVASRTFDDA
jgi:transcriptional regulator with XRE-family HTH domain